MMAKGRTRRQEQEDVLGMYEEPVPGNSCFDGRPPVEGGVAKLDIARARKSSTTGTWRTATFSQDTD